jgi:HlyD family secretion protein
VPSQALRYSPSELRGKPADRPQVWLLRDGKPVAVSVTSGLDDDTFAEIVKGELQPGDRVIVSEQREATKAPLPQPRF